MEGEAPEELLMKQHRKEKKDLQAKIQSMKNAVPKNDKKRRKQLTEEIGKLEADLNRKHEEEIRQLRSTADSKVEEVANGVETMKVEGGGEEEVKQPRVTKAQKRRDKKSAQEKERESRIAEAEVENLQGMRHQEGLKLAQKLAQKKLQIKEISSDGHCMYRAIEDQRARHAQSGLSMTVKELRSRTAEHMRENVDDFLPFLTNPDTGDVLTADEFEKYCSDVEHTAAWGGQLELRALTQVLHSPIEVIQSDSPTIRIGEEFDGELITLIYMRHAFGLGEHYDSVEPLKDPTSSEDG
ncbi:deubiquitinase OTUD6B [Nothobranchius furzeri]|uniref:ubiquitinyl hydrolase 1 n=1 Tax=Nothobranchius furzeri TaxID=105023 RepID=A0A1A8V5W6_NOTFU|nr:deubiquitinase OTUD6B [Nothobranchius furzeri]KAF7211187.1 OTU domain containing 6B [Nothobranchius furzeri]